jgi:hypothetical protein
MSCNGVNPHGTCPFLAQGIPELGGRCEGCHELRSIDLAERANTCPLCLQETDHAELCPPCSRSIALTTKTIRGERVA